MRFREATRKLTVLLLAIPFLGTGLSGLPSQDFTGPGSPSPLLMNGDSEDTGPIRGRVGWIRQAGRMSLDPEGNRTGYIFELLDKIAENANIEFDYVEASGREELLRMMDSGLVDVTAEGESGYVQEGFINLPRSIGPVNQMICARDGDTRFFEDDYESMDNMTVAMIDSPSANDKLSAFEEAKKFTTKRHYYPTAHAAKAALLTGNADLAVLDNYDDPHGVVVIAKFGLSDRFLTVREECENLKNAMMRGYGALLAEDPFFLGNMNNKYFSEYQIRNTAFTKDEQSFIRNAPPFDVYLRDDIPLVSYCSDGVFSGYFPAILKRISQRTGLRFNLKGRDNFDELAEAVKSDPTGLSICILPKSNHFHNDKMLRFAKPSASCTILMVSKRNRDKMVLTVACPSRNYALKETAEKKGYEVIEYQDERACLDAVLQEKADAAIIKGYQIQSLMGLRKYNKKLSVQLDSSMSYEISFAVPASTNKSLLAILNKASTEFSEYDLGSYTTSNMSMSFVIMSLPDILFENWYIIAIILLIFLAGLSIIVLQQRFNRKLETSNKNKDVFLADMSHDFRTPLTAISGFAYLGKSESDPRYYAEIITSAAYMQELVNDILNIRQYSEGKAIELQPEPVIAETLYDSILSVMHGRAATKNIKINFESSISYPYIAVDPMRVRQVFVNIIGNAVKYSPAGSSIEVTVEDYMKAHTARVKAVITDHGEGMSKDFIRQRIFRPFEREKNAFSAKEGGSGLGLAITKIIMDRLGGTIAVESELGEGSTFTLDFPVETITKEQYENDHTEETLPHGKEFDFSGTRVLLCEDNEVNTFIVSNILQKRGCEVDCASDGKEGLEKYTASPARYYSIILMDIRMPVMDGIEAAKAIRTLNRADAQQVPIIALSANAFEEDKMASAKAGMNAHLSKPVNVDALFRTMEQLLLTF
ncbi:MAG: response regulator [Treponema sp.]|nr:response regulator [Treponema sp.]